MARVCPDCGRRYEDDATRCPEDGAPTFLVTGHTDDLIDQVVDGRFTVKSLLGRGGMGAVYRARQHSMDRDVALKVLRPELAGDEDAVKRFFREARAASRLANPHTVTVFDFGQASSGLLYIAMELMQGRPLSKLMRATGPVHPVRAVRIVTQVLDSLSEAHAVGVLHRDIKPDNIFVLEGKGTHDFVKVLDFGIAKVHGTDSTNLTGMGMAFGTPIYMSPEQAKAGDLDARSDLYSVGVVLYELLAGRPPFEADTPLALALKKIQEEPPALVAVNPAVQAPAVLEGVLRRLIAVSPDDRPADAAEAKAVLEAAVAGMVPSFDPIPAPPPGGRGVRPRTEPTAATKVETTHGWSVGRKRPGWWVWALAVAAGIGLAGAGIGILGGKGEAVGAAETAGVAPAAPAPAAAPVVPAPAPAEPASTQGTAAATVSPERPATVVPAPPAPARAAVAAPARVPSRTGPGPGKGRAEAPADDGGLVLKKGSAGRVPADEGGLQLKRGGSR